MTPVEVGLLVLGMMSAFAAGGFVALRSRSRFDPPGKGEAGASALGEVDRRLGAMLDVTSDFIFEIDDRNRALRAYGVLPGGWTEEDLAQRHALEFVHAEDVPAMRALAAATLAGQPTAPVEVRAVQPDGRTRWMEVRASSYLAEGGGARVVCACRDVHDRKLSELAILESEARYRAMVDQSPFGVMIVNQKLDLVLANPAYARLVGADSVEALSEHNVWKSPAMGSLASREVVERVAAGERVTTEVSYMSLFDKRVDVRVHVAPLTNEEGVVMGGQLLFEDISERRVLEEQLRESQKMEAIGRLAGGIAHDFNNYLSAILGFAEVVCESSPPGAPVREAGEQIIETAERSAALTGRLLTFARRHVTRPEPVDLGILLSGLEGMLRSLLGESIRVRVDLAKASGRVLGDPTLLEQIVVNLAVNAREAMPEGGDLSIGLENSTLPSPEARDSALVLTVEDSGVGMDEETAARVFEPFFTTRSETGGTGLGLATVYGIVREMNGSIEVESELGRGAKFRVTLPCAEEPVSGERRESASPADSRALDGGERILVVEDEASIRRLTAGALRRRGYDVTAAANGQEALEILRERGDSIDLLLTDVMMPGIQGTDLASEARRRNPQLPVLLMTGYSESLLALEGGLPDGFELISKPVAPSEIVCRVRARLDRTD